jgi:hypothetical protein
MVCAQHANHDQNMYRLKIKIIAIFLILAFTQKLGLGLYLHNWFHENRNYCSQNKEGFTLDQCQVKCTCIEDALMPLTPSANLDEIKSPEKYFSSFSNSYHTPTSSVVKIFYGLRGPPRKAV